MAIDIGLHSSNKLLTVFNSPRRRLVNLTLTAPELLADAVYGVWTEGLASLRLETPRGATVELGATID